MPSTAQNHIRFGLFQKGLIIVLLPMLVNFFGIILLNYNRALSSKALESSRGELSKITMLSGDIFAITKILAAGNYAIWNNVFKHSQKDIIECLDSFEKELSTAPYTTAPLVESRSQLLVGVGQLRRAIARAEQDLHANDSWFGRARPLKNWTKLCRIESELLKRELETEYARYIQEVQLQQKYEQFITWLGALVLIANILLACFLANWYHRDIARRMAQLVKTAKRLPLNERLLETTPGDDELTNLGRELNKVSAELADARDMRQTLMQMMAHDVRSPMMALDVSMALLESTLADGLSVEAASRLSEAKISLANCLLMVSDLLLLERLEHSDTSPDREASDIKKIFSVALRKIKKSADEKFVEIVDEVQAKSLLLDADQIALVIQRMLLTAIQRAPARSTVICTGVASTTTYDLYVHDPAILITTERGVNLFDKFYQAAQEDQLPDLGLGLAVALPIVRLHGGTTGQGIDDNSSFVWMKLPLPEQVLSHPETREF